eukprot:7648691-Pyramimonas_sp.AAC.1
MFDPAARSNEVEEIRGLEAVPALRVLMLGRNRVSQIQVGRSDQFDQFDPFYYPFYGENHDVLALRQEASVTFMRRTVTARRLRALHLCDAR